VTLASNIEKKKKTKMKYEPMKQDTRYKKKWPYRIRII